MNEFCDYFFTHVKKKCKKDHLNFFLMSINYSIIRMATLHCCQTQVSTLKSRSECFIFRALFVVVGRLFVLVAFFRACFLLWLY